VEKSMDEHGVPQKIKSKNAMQVNYPITGYIFKGKKVSNPGTYALPCSLLHFSNRKLCI
jgi:hypothetical protein